MSAQGEEDQQQLLRDVFGSENEDSKDPNENAEDQQLRDLFGSSDEDDEVPAKYELFTQLYT